MSHVRILFPQPAYKKVSFAPYLDSWMVLTYTPAGEESGAAVSFPFNIFFLPEEPITRPSMTQIVEPSMFSFIVDSVEHCDDP